VPYTTRRLNLGRSPQLDALALECGRLYSLTVATFWRVVRKKGLWLKPSSLMRLLTSKALHAHTADATVQAFFASLKSWRVRRKTNPETKPPSNRPRHFGVTYKSTAMRLRDGNLVLSNGRGNEPLVIEGWTFDLPCLVRIRWRGDQYELIATYAQPEAEPITEGRVAALDLGEVHVAGCSDGWLVNGRELRSLRRQREKTKQHLQVKMDRKKKGSTRWRRLKTAKARQLRKLDRRLRDLLHKATTGIVSTLLNTGVQTLVVGDLKGIRDGLDYGPKSNQKLHQWLYGRTIFQLRYKAERVGMAFELQDESYTSQTCPACGERHKPNGRVYRCNGCGFTGHRDVHVGPVNIRAKYLGEAPVAAGMAPAWGIRLTPHLPVAQGFVPREATAL